MGLGDGPPAGTNAAQAHAVPPLPPPPEPERTHGSLGAYVACLRDNPHFRVLWLAEVVGELPTQEQQPPHTRSPPPAPAARSPAASRPRHLPPCTLPAPSPLHPTTHPHPHTDNLGSWLNYVATLSLVDEFSGGSGLALSAVVLIRFLPSLLLAPISGVVADRWGSGVGERVWG